MLFCGTLTVRGRGNGSPTLRRPAHRAYIGRQVRGGEDREEIDAAAARMAGEAEYLRGRAGEGPDRRTVFGFDTLEKAQAMQA
jgi:hypothetical protein